MSKHDKYIQELYEKFKENAVLNSTDFYDLHFVLGKYIRENYLALDEYYYYFCDYYNKEDEDILSLNIIKDLKEYKIKILQNNLLHQD